MLQERTFTFRANVCAQRRANTVLALANSHLAPANAGGCIVKAVVVGVQFMCC